MHQFQLQFTYYDELHLFVFRANAGDCESADLFFKAAAEQLKIFRHQLKSFAVKVLDKDGFSDDIIDELLLKREILEKLVALDSNIRSRNRAAIMSALSDLILAVGNAR